MFDEQLQSPDEAVLIEYLDGELPPTDRQKIEKRLAEEPLLREQLKQFEESWQCLDLLVQEKPDQKLVETTLKFVCADLEGKVGDKESGVRKKYRCQKFFSSWKYPILYVVLFLIAFQSGRRLASNDDPFFYEAINRLDMYLAVIDEGTELLRLMTEKRLFLPPLPADAAPIDPNEYRPPQRIELWDILFHQPATAENKFLDESFYNRFYNNLKRFRELSAEKKEKIRTIHNNIEFAPRRVELILTLQNYYLWRKSLQSYEKAELRRPCTVSEKLEQIVELKNRLADQSPVSHVVSEIPTAEEEKNLAAKLDQLSMQQKDQILGMSPEQVINFLKQLQTDD
jgi:hypothetical protein